MVIQYKFILSNKSLFSNGADTNKTFNILGFKSIWISLEILNNSPNINI